MANLPLVERFTRVMHGVGPYLPDEMREEFGQILNPGTLAVVAGTLALWAGSHYVGIGFAVDAVLLTTGLVFLGWQVWGTTEDFARAMDLTVNATTAAELDDASHRLANVIAVIGIAAFLALLTKGIKTGASRIRVARASRMATNAMVDLVLTKRLGSTKNVGTQVRRNVRVVVEFLTDPDNSARWGKPFTTDKILEVFSGIDLHAASPVRIETLKKGTRLTQRVSATQALRAEREGFDKLGQWFSVSGISDRNLGIAGGDRKYQVFRLKKDVQVIRSKASGVSDTWTHGRDPNVQSPRHSTKPQLQTDTTGVREIYPKTEAGELVSGGGIQFFIPEGGAIVDPL